MSKFVDSEKHQNNSSTTYWKIPVPWGDGTTHEVLVEWALKFRDKVSEVEIRKSLHCLAAYLQDPPPEDRYLRPYKPTRCIVRSTSGKLTSPGTVIASNPNGEAYLDADPFPHQSVWLRFDVHIYTDKDGIYDRDRETSWSLLKAQKLPNTEVFEKQSWIEPRMYIYADEKNRVYAKDSNKCERSLDRAH